MNKHNKEELISYLKSTGLYEDDQALKYVIKRLDENYYISVKDLIERFIKIDKAYDNTPWNIKQILNNIVCYDYDFKKEISMKTPIRYKVLHFFRSICKKISGKQYSCCDKLFVNCSKCKYVLEDDE